MKKVLIILCSYNGEKYIQEQIISILEQKYIYFDLFIFDDKSNDNTIKIINNFIDSRINLHINKVNSGSPALNFLFALQWFSQVFYDKYDYISFADQDDIWLNNKLSEAIKKLVSTKASLYSSNLIIWNTLTNKQKILKKNFKQTKYDYLFEGASAGCTYLFTTQFAKSLKYDLIGINLKNWKFLSHDWLIYFYARLNEYKVVIDDKSYILYRIHHNNVHGSLNINNYKSFAKRISLLRDTWYFEQINGFKAFLDPKSEELYIYELFQKNWFTRFLILTKYNFELLRSKRKFIKFFILNIFLKQ